MNEEESQQSIECKAAIRAALEKVGEYCGLGEMGERQYDPNRITMPGNYDIDARDIPSDVTELLDRHLHGGGRRVRDELENNEWIILQSQKAQSHAMSDDADPDLKRAYLKYAKDAVIDTLLDHTFTSDEG
jgi:hypothetical protein